MCGGIYASHPAREPFSDITCVATALHEDRKDIVGIVVLLLAHGNEDLYFVTLTYRITIIKLIKNPGLFHTRTPYQSINTSS